MPQGTKFIVKNYPLPGGRTKALSNFVTVTMDRDGIVRELKKRPEFKDVPGESIDIEIVGGTETLTGKDRLKMAGSMGEQRIVPKKVIDAEIAERVASDPAAKPAK